MAKDAKPVAESAEPGAVAAPKKSKKLLIIIAGVVLLLIVGGGAAFFLLQKNADHGDEEEVVSEKASKKKKGDKEAAPVYVALDVFTVNLVPEQGDQFLQLGISLEVTDASVGDRLRTHTPKVRNKVMLLLSDKKASQLITKDGKEKLAEEIREQLNEIVEPTTAKGKKTEDPVKEVLFTSFIIQ